MAKRSNFTWSQKPMLYHSRSRFDLSHHHKTMFNEGQLIPFYVQEVYPGDTFKVKTSSVTRTTTPFLRPVMDNLFLDMFYFFVPNRLVYDKWQVVMGENKQGYWSNTEVAAVPQVSSYGNGIGTIADYMGIPVVSSERCAPNISALPFRAYALIWNEWFRDENTQAPVLINTGDFQDDQYLNSAAWSVQNIFGKPAPINKLHDYFTSCLPSPQKGDPVDLPFNGNVPVYSTRTINPNPLSVVGSLGEISPIQFLDNNWGRPFSSVGLYNAVFQDLTITDPTVYLGGISSSTSGTPGPDLNPSNLQAIFNNANLGLNVNDLRTAFQVQKLLEKDARGGTRYTEYLQEHFGVISPDSRLQRPEFLGGKRMPLSIQQVAQTSSGTEDSPLAQVSAFSLSNGICGMSKGFVEHGFIIGVMAVRQFHTYQQGIEKFWFRQTRLDYYDPVFSNIGEQPVYTKEIFAESVEDQVFGYNEAWADLRYRPSRISGMLRSQANQGFDIWHFADNYVNAPMLSDTFMRETNLYLNRTLSVDSSLVPNFVIDIFNKVEAIRPLPTYSVPGLIDHH